MIDNIDSFRLVNISNSDPQNVCRNGRGLNNRLADTHFASKNTQKTHFALLHLAQKNSLLQIGLLQFAL